MFSTGGRKEELYSLLFLAAWRKKISHFGCRAERDMALSLLGRPKLVNWRGEV